jgi:transcriptional regulator with XRE-family HTH domain
VTRPDALSGPQDAGRVAADLEAEPSRNAGRKTVADLLGVVGEPMWRRHRLGTVISGSVAKFSSSGALRSYLVGTGERVLVEVSPRDRILGDRHERPRVVVRMETRYVCAIRTDSTKERPQMTPTVDVVDLLRRVRRESGLSQRAFAEIAGTSGPTVAAYESGAKEPRLSTLHRLAASADYRVEVRLVPAGRGATRRARRERRSLAVAAATAAAVERDVERAHRLAVKNLSRSEQVVGDNVAQQWIAEWRAVLDRGPKAVRATLLDPSPHGHDMRQMTPFAGLLTEVERNAAFAVADAFDVMEQVS